jgi:predicted permease
MNALRRLRRAPLLTATILVTLALGVGANTAIFSFIDAILLRSLPVRNPRELVTIQGYDAQARGNTAFSSTMFRDLAARKDLFSGILATSASEFALATAGSAEHLSGDMVSGNYFDVLGVQPHIGRLIRLEDDQPNAPLVTVLSFRLWQQQFGSDPAIVGRAVSLNGHAATVVGVSGKGFYGTSLSTVPALFVPLIHAPQFRPNLAGRIDDPLFGWLKLLARIKPGVTAKRVESAVSAYYAALLDRWLKELAGKRVNDTILKRLRAQYIVVEPAARGFSGFRHRYERPLWILLTGTMLVLLIACANVANLLLARAQERERETAVRLAIGAGRLRLIRDLMWESLILALAGGALGLLVGQWLSDALLRFLPRGTALGPGSAMNYRVLAFTFLVACGTAVVFGLAPAFHVVRVPILSGLRAGGTPPGHRWFHARGALMTAQVALSIILLSTAGLFLRSLHNLRSVDVGFRRDEIVGAGVSLSPLGYSPERAQIFTTSLLARLREAPGISGAAITDVPLIDGSFMLQSIVVEGQGNQTQQDLSANLCRVSPGYFATLGIPLIDGREFLPSDTAAGPKVVIVNEAFARLYFPRQNAVGRRMGMAARPGSMPDAEIVGVAKNGKYADLREDTREFFYVPEAKIPPTRMTIYVRSNMPSDQTVAILRREVHALDAQVPLDPIRTLAEQIEESISDDRLLSTLLILFGLLAAALVVTGLYGVLAFSVARRMREIGVRRALGAQVPAIAATVLRQVFWFTGIGIAIGIAGGLALGRVASALLYEVKPHDAAAFAGAAIGTAVIALAAAAMPIRAALRVEPMITLRYE